LHSPNARSPDFVTINTFTEATAAAKGRQDEAGEERRRRISAGALGAGGHSMSPQPPRGWLHKEIFKPNPMA